MTIMMEGILDGIVSGGWLPGASFKRVSYCNNSDTEPRVLQYTELRPC